MIETNDVKIHIDPRGDRIEKKDFVIDGWIAAQEPIKAVWLPASSTSPPPICERADAMCVVPGREPIGFSSKCSNHDVGPNRFRNSVQIGHSTLEVQQPRRAPRPGGQKPPH